MKEIWKQIDWGDGRYYVSNLGNVKSTYANKEKILKPFPDHRGYLKVDLRSPGCRKTFSIHRLVARYFIPNPNNLPEVNHKDEDKTHNYESNLEWCDTLYNCNYGTRNARKAEGCHKPVCSVDKDGNISYYKSRLEASDITGIGATNISKALSDNYSNNKTAGGLLWFYYDKKTEEYIRENKIKAKTNKKSVYSIDSNGNIEHYISTSEAKSKTGINNITRAIKNGTFAGGKRWFYDD